MKEKLIKIHGSLRNSSDEETPISILVRAALREYADGVINLSGPVVDSDESPILSCAIRATEYEGAGNTIPFSGFIFSHHLNMDIGVCHGCFTTEQITEQRKPGRRKNPARKVAVALGKELLTHLGYKSGVANGLLSAKLGFDGEERSIRKILSDTDTKDVMRTGRCLVSVWIDKGHEEHSSSLIMMFDEKPAISVSDEKVSIEGAGWFWYPWIKEALYGKACIDIACIDIEGTINIEALRLYCDSVPMANIVFVFNEL